MILIIEDDQSTGIMMEYYFKNILKCEVSWVTNIIDAERFCHRNKPKIIILDCLLIDGVSDRFYDIIKLLYDTPPIIIPMSASDSYLSKFNTTHKLRKPFLLEHLDEIKKLLT